MKDDYICALSGLTPTEEEIDGTTESLPEGWVEITIKRVFPNQKYFILQQLKNQAIQLTLSQIPENQREEAIDSVRVQVEAQYHSYESSLKEFEVESDVIYISPPENDESILAEYKKLSEMLGFDALLYDDDENNDGDDEEENAEEDGESEISKSEDSTTSNKESGNDQEK